MLGLFAYAMRLFGRGYATPQGKQITLFYPLKSPRLSMNEEGPFKEGPIRGVWWGVLAGDGLSEHKLMVGGINLGLRQADVSHRYSRA